MRKAAFILFLIGAVFALIGGAGYLTFAIMGFNGAIPNEIITKILSSLKFLKGDIKPLYVACIVLGSIGLVMSCLGFLCPLLRRGGKAYYIIMLVLTLVVHFDIFYLIASIIGIADNRVYYD